MVSRSLNPNFLWSSSSAVNINVAYLFRKITFQNKKHYTFSMMRKMSITGFLNFKIYVFETKLNLLMYFYMVQFLLQNFLMYFPQKLTNWLDLTVKNKLIAFCCFFFYKFEVRLKSMSKLNVKLYCSHM